MKVGTLSWREVAEEGKVNLPKDWADMNYTWRMDIVADWLRELNKIQDDLIKEGRPSRNNVVKLGDRK